MVSVSLQMTLLLFYIMKIYITFPAGDEATADTEAIDAIMTQTVINPKLFFLLCVVRHPYDYHNVAGTTK